MSNGDTYVKIKYHEKRAWMFDILGNECSVCGTTQELKLVYVEPHTPGFHVCRNWSATKERLRDELKKCRLMCSRHYGESLSKLRASDKPEKEPVYKNFDIVDTEEL